MLRTKNKCPHCGEEVVVGLYNKYWRQFKWMKCSSCENYFTFDFLKRLGLIKRLFLLLFVTILAVLIIVAVDYLYRESIVMIIILLFSIAYISHKATKDFKKIDDNTKTEAKWTYISAVSALIWISFVIKAANLVSFSVFDLNDVKENILLKDRMVLEEESFKDKLLEKYNFDKNIKIYLNRKSAWKSKCEHKKDFHCRLASRISSYESNIVEEMSLLEKACENNDRLACYRLYSFDHKDKRSKDSLKKFLIMTCLDDKGPKNYCNLVGRLLYVNNDKKESLEIFKNQCLKYKDEISCLKITQFFPVKQNISYHQNACKEKIDISCDALRLNNIKIDNEGLSTNKKKEQEELIIISAKLGLENVVKKLISSGQNVNSADKFGSTLLYIAVAEENLSLVKFLIKNGAKIDLPNNVGFTPLMYSTNLPWKYGKDIFSILLKNGANFSIKDKFNSTALDHSASNYDHEYFNILIEKNIFLNLIFESHISERLVSKGYYKNLRYLFDKFDSNKIFQKIMPIKLVELAIKNSSKETLEVLFNEFNKNKISLNEYHDNIIIWANQRGNLDIINFLKEKSFSNPVNFFNSIKVGLYKYFFYRQKNI